eukprot:2796040-Rhodomonas_salina.1
MDANQRRQTRVLFQLLHHFQPPSQGFHSSGRERGLFAGEGVTIPRYISEEICAGGEVRGQTSWRWPE